MKFLSLALIVCVALVAAGCEKISKPYIMTVDRTDQKVDGNRGYLKGTPPPAGDNSGRKRSLIAVDMDLVDIKGKPAKDTMIVTKEGNKAIFPSASENSDDKNIK